MAMPLCVSWRETTGFNGNSKW